MGGIEKSYRLTADGSQVVREFDRVGDAGARMENKIRQGAAGMSPALRAVDAAAGQARGAVEGAAKKAGGLGTVLTALGPMGLAAAAGIGAAVVAFNALQSASHGAVDSLGQIYTAAQHAGTSVEFLQEMRYAVQQVGEQSTVADSSITAFAIKLGDAQRKGGEVLAAFQKLGFTREQVNSFHSVQEALPQIADRLHALAGDSQLPNIADALGLREMLPALQQGSEALDRTRAAARNLGIVLDESTIRRAREMSVAWQAASDVLDTKMKVAVMDLAPHFIRLVQIMADGAAWLTRFMDQFDRLENRANTSLSSELRDIQRERSELAAAHGGVGAMQGGDPARGDWRHSWRAQFAVSADDARNRYAYLSQQEERIAAEFASRRESSYAAPALPGLSPLQTVNAQAAAINTLVERVEQEQRARAALLAVQAEYPKASAQEQQARVALLDVMGQLDAARASGAIASDAELQRLKALAQGSYDAAQATRVLADAERARAELASRVDQMRAQVETPEERLRRERGDLMKLYDSTRGQPGGLDPETYRRQLSRIADEYNQIADSQRRASFEGKALDEILGGQIRTWNDLALVLLRLGGTVLSDAVRNAGGLDHGGIGGFAGRVWSGVQAGFGLGGDKDAGAISSLGDAAAGAGAKIATALTPSVAETVAKMALSHAASVTESSAKVQSTMSLTIMSKAADAAAQALARVAISGGGGGKSDLVGTIVSAFTGGGKSALKGPGRAAGGDLWPGYLHSAAERGPELMLLGGSAHVFSNDVFEGFKAIGLIARQAAHASAPVAQAPRVAVNLRNESGASIAVDRGDVTTGPNGELNVDLILTRGVSGVIGQGKADSAMRLRYGVRPSRIRRG